MIMDNDSDGRLDGAISAASRLGNGQSVQSSKGQSFAGVVFLEFGIATWLIYGLMSEIGFIDPTGSALSWVWSIC